MTEKHFPIKDITPLTKYDYWNRQHHIFFKQTPIIDLEMIYGHTGNEQVFVFDKYGEWCDEGVYHEALNLENTYDEVKWFDSFNSNTYG